MSLQIAETLKTLKLPGIKACYEQLADQARSEHYSYERYLAEVLEREREQRQKNRIERLLRVSKIPLEKNLDSFNRSRLPTKVDAQLSVLLEGTFVDHAENVLAFGNPGSGKTHLLCALKQELLIAKKELKLASILRKLSRFQALLIDDIGYVQQNREEMEVLFTLLAHRYERGTVMVTSNLPFSEWEKIFKDPMTTAAAIDRLVHHSVILELNIPSYRLEDAKRGRKK